ncbi:hypothetical protein [Algoriphagus confluentis]|uniref:Uncharacterized protein n=1 Tax=Algoriphagus confluentis TaxID=1697556 RepID=A0ABQ6PNA3_9BACT|nr:hypothetical protein Aconfl_21020 [Algoriphagus confluentis]
MTRHFYEISQKDLDNRAFRRGINKLENGDQVFWIFDGNDRLGVQGKVEIYPQRLFKRETRGFFNEDNSQKSQTTKNLNDAGYVESIFDEGEKRTSYLFG